MYISGRLPLSTLIIVTVLLTIVPYGFVKLTFKLLVISVLHKDSARTAQ